MEILLFCYIIHSPTDVCLRPTEACIPALFWTGERTSDPHWVLYTVPLEGRVADLDCATTNPVTWECEPVPLVLCVHVSNFWITKASFLSM